MKRLGSTLVTAVFACSLIVTPVLAEPSANSLEANKAAAEAQVSSLQQQLTELLTKVGDLEEQLIAKGEAIIKSESDLKDAEEKQKEQYDDMKLRIKYMYEVGDVSALEALVSVNDFSELVNKAEYVQNVHSYDRRMLQEYIDTTNKIDTLKNTLQDEQKKLEVIKEEYEVKEVELSTTLETKKSEIADFDVQLQAAAQAAAQRSIQENPQLATDNNMDRNQGSSNSGGGDQSVAPPVNNGNTGGGSGDIGNVGNAGNTSAAQAIVSAAYSQLGVPYVYGGTNPGSGLDCSGLTQYAHRMAGISIGRTSEVQGGGGVAVSNPQPGDIVCYGGHVGIYIGGGSMIHAPQPGDVVKVAGVYGSPWYRRYW